MHNSSGVRANSRPFKLAHSISSPAGILGLIPDLALCRFNTKALMRSCPRCLASAHGSAHYNGPIRCRKCLCSSHNSGNCPIQSRFSCSPLCIQSDPSSSGTLIAPQSLPGGPRLFRSFIDYTSEATGIVPSPIIIPWC